MIALFAAFALLVQILAPGLASAGPRLPEGAMLLCADGGPAAKAGAPVLPGVDDHHCDHCVCPPPPLTAAAPEQIGRIAYASTAAAPAPPARFRTPPARAPPRPPGQGPPTSDA